MTHEDFAAVLRARRSIDLFEPEPVGSGVLLEAIDVARWAPNHRLTEPWRFYVIGAAMRDAVIELAAELDAAAKGERAGEARRARLKGIPGYFVLTSRRSDDALTEREDYAACCCAAQNLMLYLWQRGVGVKWTTGGITRQQRFYDLARDRFEQGSRGRFFLVRCSESRAGPEAQKRCKRSLRNDHNDKRSLFK